MGNKILGKRSRSFYKGFNQRQVQYLKQKFELISKNGKLDKDQFIKSYKVSDATCERFLASTDFDQNSGVDQYQFICMVHSLCCQTVQGLGKLLYDIITKKKDKLTQKNLLQFTKTCLQYNSYIQKKPINQKQIIKLNKQKFEKYNYDAKEGSTQIDQKQFISICLKDEDYKKWLFNMGLITKRQMDYQEDIYDLVDSDIGDQIDRLDKEIKENVSKIKQGIQHRLDDDEFQMQEVAGEQNAPRSQPWNKQTQKIIISQQNLEPPNQSLQIQYIFGYRSFDCRNNMKFDSDGKIIYHQAAVGIVYDYTKNQQKFLNQHHDDITCVDVAGNTVVTGETGAYPMVIVWQSPKKTQQTIKPSLIITDGLKDGISCVSLFKTEKQAKIAVICNDSQHRLLIYDLNKLKARQDNPTLADRGIIASGNTTPSLPFGLKFDANGNYVIIATLRQLLFITFQKGVLNANRGQFGAFTLSSALCIETLTCKYKSQQKKFIISGMGNGSIYFWQNQTCVKAISGHNGSVSSLCLRKDKKSFISGDKTGNIIIWNSDFTKQYNLNVPKSNSVSNMIVSLSCRAGQLLVGTKASDIYVLKIGDKFEKAQKIMSGHSDGILWGLAVHPTQGYAITGGEDRRIIKWDYIKKKMQKQRKCQYPIRSIDLFNGKQKQNFLVVGYKNGIVQCFNPNNLQSLQKRYTEIKNPDEQVLNLVRINEEGTMCAVCYQYPNFCIRILNLVSKQLTKISQIKASSKILAVDFDKVSNYIRFNTAKNQYIVYDISGIASRKQAVQVKKITDKKYQQAKSFFWATHTLPFSAETKGIFAQGVLQSDITCCQLSRRYPNVFVIGDKYSKIKLFNYPSKQNNIFNKYVGHSNQVTALQFDKIKGNQHLISIGGEEKSIIVWKYNSQQLKNQWFIEKLGFKYGEEIQETQQVEKQRKRKQELLKANSQAFQVVQGEQAMATKAFLGQIKPPSDYKQNYNSKRDNVVPDVDISISHVFGLRNRYISDQVRNQVKFASGEKHVLFPTACLGVKMRIQTRQQQFYHQHRQDIVSFAVDNSRKYMATGQMAEKNPQQPRKKIVCIYVWDIQTKQVLNKLDGFHTIAVVLLSFSPDNKLLFSVGNDDKNTFAIYDWKSGTIIHSGPTSRGKVNGISWMNNSQFMTCGMDNVKFWSGSKSLIGRTHNDFKKQEKNGAFFSCVASKKVYITGSGKGGIYNWLGNNSGPKINAHSGKVHTLVYYNDFVYSGGADGKIFRWKTQSNGQIKIAQKFYDTRQAFTELVKKIADVPQQIQKQYGVLSIDFGRNKDQFVVGTVGASIIYHNSKRSEVIHQGHYCGELWALSTQPSNNQNLIITGGDDKTVRMWDIKAKKQISRAYFSEKIRGMDWASDGSKIVVADDRARVYLYNGTNLSQKPIAYEGKPFMKNNTKQSKGAFVQDIKFSPNNEMVAYGCHGQSMTMQILDVSNKKLTLRKSFMAGSSAVLHVDWSRDGKYISINTQAYQLLFFDSNGEKAFASALADQKWATWTRKIGFQVKGIFQGVDYTDVNTVCREPDSQFIAVGYDDQCIRLFKYPCYIQKQVHKIYPGHSSHVTRIKFTQEKMVSLGGLDRTIIVWDVHRPKKKVSKGYDNQSDDGLDDLQEDVDLPNKAVTRKPKKQDISQFYTNQDEGDQFMAIKPWLGAIKQPTYQYPKQTSKPPNVQLTLQYVHGYRVKDCRQNLYYLDQKHIIFHAAAVLIFHNIQQNTQELKTDHNDDILSIDYHKPSNQVITGQLGPKPLVCLYQNAKLTMKFHAPVKKGVLAIAISPDGRRAACAGMDDDHHVAVLDLKTGKVLACEKGTKKVITKIIWTSNNNFVSVGISHYKYWTFDNKLSGKQSPKRYNFVCVAYDEQTQKVYTGASKGTIIVWNRSDAQKQQISLSRTVKDKDGQKAEQFQMPTSVVDCLQIYRQKKLLLAGTKDGSIFVIDKANKSVLKQIKLQSILQKNKLKSQCTGVRSINILKNKMLVGTLGAEIYELTFQDLTNKVRQISNCTNILKCHYSPNNTWTNQVWGLDVHDDFIFTCSDDATVRCWSLSKRKLLSCASTNQLLDGTKMEKDKRTNDFIDAAKSRAVCVSPNGEQVIVGSKDGTVRVFEFDANNYSLILKNVFRHAQQWISDIKFAYNTLIIGSHDNAIYVYNYEQGKIKKKYAPLKKHSSYITHMDVSKDSCFLQSTCGAYELLFWDLNNGKQVTSGATLLRDERWQTWTCNLGWPVQGIYPKVTDGTFINAVDRSHRSINNTLDKQDSVSPYLLAAGNDNGKVAVYNYPCTIKSSSFVQGKGHSSHVTNVKWSLDDRYIISVGGQDQCLMYWRVNKTKK